MKVEVFSDGSSDGKSGGVGGWAFVVLVDGEKVYEASGSEDNATNNSMELRAALEGLKWVDTYVAGSPNPAGTLREVILWSDSQLVLGWASSRYRCKAMHLIPLCFEIRTYFNKLGAKDCWVKGHDGNEWNEKCDTLCKAARTAGSQSAPLTGNNLKD
jgi:ribonuclease HI